MRPYIENLYYRDMARPTIKEQVRDWLSTEIFGQEREKLALLTKGWYVAFIKQGLVTNHVSKEKLILCVLFPDPLKRNMHSL